jgi:hypothetical protein
MEGDILEDLDVNKIIILKVDWNDLARGKTKNIEIYS